MVAFSISHNTILAINPSLCVGLLLVSLIMDIILIFKVRKSLEILMFYIIFFREKKKENGLPNSPQLASIFIPSALVLYSALASLKLKILKNKHCNYYLFIFIDMSNYVLLHLSIQVQFLLFFPYLL